MGETAHARISVTRRNSRAAWASSARSQETLAASRRSEEDRCLESARHTGVDDGQSGGAIDTSRRDGHGTRRDDYILARFSHRHAGRPAPFLCAAGRGRQRRPPAILRGSRPVAWIPGRRRCNRRAARERPSRRVSRVEGTRRSPHRSGTASSPAGVVPRQGQPSVTLARLAKAGRFS